MKKYFAGIGARLAIKNKLIDIFYYAQRLRKLGYILRSGAAKGCDEFFENGYEGYKEQTEIFKAKDATPWSLEMVKKYLPKDYLPRALTQFDNWRPNIKGLLARDMMQILGADGQTPVEFVVCWTKSLNYEYSAVGGTGYALRCALDYNIPIYNLVSEEQTKMFEEFLKNEEDV